MLAVFGLAIASCRREPVKPGGDEVVPQTGGAPSRAELVFPAELRVEDETVNAFLEQAMQVTTGGDYDVFRTLWVAVDEPFARDQFDRGWQSLVRLRVEVLQKIRDPVDQAIIYGLYAVAELDPEALPAGEEPQRRVVLELRREAEGWKFANARDDVRRAVIELHRRANPEEEVAAKSAP
ncbi:MAG: hypothetical protein FLDDKLPJ_00520 [Phycisphaerae bacterium]|nr:hypothetical protein [Phycisphaerae bacterium]